MTPKFLLSTKVSRRFSVLLLSALHLLGSHATLTPTSRQIHRTKQGCSPSGFGLWFVGACIYFSPGLRVMSSLPLSSALLPLLSIAPLAFLSSLLVKILRRNSYCSGF
ncbi:hypothetical protein K438DRAFT_763228 [Mycena galopus ATCC 62051]|nr:hypothetical protein K438DRAFT_763228 [Mycena galopus ATCC 62051]